MEANDAHRYDDIIGLAHHVSAKHPALPMSSRAAQFLPFAALPGYGEVIAEASREMSRGEEICFDRAFPYSSEPAD